VYGLRGKIHAKRKTSTTTQEHLNKMMQVSFNLIKVLGSIIDLDIQYSLSQWRIQKFSLMGAENIIEQPIKIFI
jgi:hypothetical protein